MSLKAYDSYRKSNLEWLDEVPDHWEHKKIAWDLPYVVGWTPPSGKDEFYDGEHPWVTIADMTRGNIEDTQSKITDAAIDAKKAEIVPAGSMLFSFKLSVGKVAFLKIDSYTNEAIAAFRPTNGISLEFWKYAAPEIIPHYGRENIYGAKLLNQELIGSARFYCPPVEEQTQIARFLDHETAKIDTLIREQERLIQLLQEKRQAVISHAVTKGLDPDVPMKDSGVEWLGEVPAHWEAARVKHVATLITSGPRGWSDFITEVSGDVFLQSGDLDGNLGLKLDTAKRVKPPSGAEGMRTELKNGDVVVCITGANTGRVAVVEDLKRTTFINQHLSLIRTNLSQIDPRYLALCLSSLPGRSYFDVVQYGLKEGLSLSNVNEAPIALPSSEEQELIVRTLNKLIDKFNGLSEVTSEQIALLKERRSALISAAVTGKIDVRSWQPPQDESDFDEEVRPAGMEATA